MTGAQTLGMGDPALARGLSYTMLKNGAETPRKLWFLTGIWAPDHAVELLYRPIATEAPTKIPCFGGDPGAYRVPAEGEKVPKEWKLHHGFAAGLNELSHSGWTTHRMWARPESLYRLRSRISIPHSTWDNLIYRPRRRYQTKGSKRRWSGTDCKGFALCRAMQEWTWRNKCAYRGRCYWSAGESVETGEYTVAIRIWQRPGGEDYEDMDTDRGGRAIRWRLCDRKSKLSIRADD